MFYGCDKYLYLQRGSSVKRERWGGDSKRDGGGGGGGGGGQREENIYSFMIVASSVSPLSLSVCLSVHVLFMSMCWPQA